jgi:2-polyprenyl-3-methyl-5-hydroxy-6-metoxy-1,4-benzoquinol methylase
MTATDQTIDSRLEAFADQLFGAALGAAELTVTYLGRTLGLYQALRGRGLTVAELAAAAGVDARYAQEWVEHQAVAGVVDVDDASRPADERRYELPEAHAIALLDEEHPAYVGALTDIPAIVGRTLDAVSAAFRTGAGVPFADYGLHDMQAGFTRPMFASSLVSEWIPALPDVHRRLVDGAALRIADFGCGEGWAAIYLAEAYPAVTVDGFDLDDASIAAARKHAADRGVGDRVHFEVRDITDGSTAGAYDLVYACEVIHDLADPVGALRGMRRLAAADGAVLIIDENASETFEAPGDPIQRLLYAFSILHCLPVGRTAEESSATGTVMRPDTLRAYAAQAGFSSVDVLPIEHPMFRFYRPQA